MDDLLDTFMVQWVDDDNIDPFLVCTRCSVAVCSVEDRDSLGVLARTARAHRQESCR